MYAEGGQDDKEMEYPRVNIKMMNNGIKLLGVGITGKVAEKKGDSRGIK